MWSQYRRTRRYSEDEDSAMSRSESPAYDLQNFWAEDNPLNQGIRTQEMQGARARIPNEQPPPPYPGMRPEPVRPEIQPTNTQLSADVQELKTLLTGILQAQHNHQQQNNDLANRFRDVGRNLEQLANTVQDLSQRGVVAPGGGHGNPGNRNQTFKPSMFRSLDMKQVDKNNKLLSEEFETWKMNIHRVLQANPAVANLPIQQLTALILAGIGHAAEKRLASLGPNPQFLGLPEFFTRMKSIFCSATVRTDAMETFEKAKQNPSEDINAWHARIQLYFHNAYGEDDNAYWNLCLKRYFQGLRDRALARKTISDYVNKQPNGYHGQCTREGYANCLQLTLQCQGETGFINHLFDDNSNSRKPYLGHQSAGEAMDTTYVSRSQPSRNNTSRSNQRNINTTSSNPNTTQSQSRPSNPPGGMQKRLKRQYHENSSQKPKARDFSKDKCNKCKLLGHWARDCPTTNNVGSTNTQETPIETANFSYETQDWMESDSISTIRESEFPKLGADCIQPPHLN